MLHCLQVAILCYSNNNYYYCYHLRDEAEINILALFFHISGQRQSWKTTGEFGVWKYLKCDIIPSVLRHCWLGDTKLFWSVKSWVLVCWWWWYDCSFAWLIDLVVTTTYIILSFSKSANPGLTGKWPLQCWEREEGREKERFCFPHVCGYRIFLTAESEHVSSSNLS